MRLNRLVWGLLAAASMLVPAVGQAQVYVQGGVQAGYGQPTYQQQPVYQQQQQVYQQPQYQQQPVYQQQQQVYTQDLPRFRFALTGGAGLGGGEVGTLFLEATLQLGVQVNDLLAIYYRPRGQIGVIWTNPPPGASGAVGLYASLYNPVLVDFTLGEIFQVGVGPSFDYLTLSACSDSACLTGFNYSGFGFGGDGRIALSFPYYSGRQSVFVGMSRGGYTVEINFHIGGSGFDRSSGFWYGQVGIAGGWILY